MASYGFWSSKFDPSHVSKVLGFGEDLGLRTSELMASGTAAAHF
jgi:hypothetical protein